MDADARRPALDDADYRYPREALDGMDAEMRRPALDDADYRYPREALVGIDADAEFGPYTQANKLHRAAWEENRKTVSRNFGYNLEPPKIMAELGGNPVEVGARFRDGADGMQVQLADRRYVPLSELEFADATVKTVYDAAGRYDALGAQSFLDNYTPNIPFSDYVDLFDRNYKAGLSGRYADAVRPLNAMETQSMSRNRVQANAGRDASIEGTHFRNAGDIDAQTPGGYAVPRVIGEAADTSTENILNFNGESGILRKNGTEYSNNTVEMYRKKKDPSVPEPMPKRQFQKIVKEFKKRGGIIQMDDATDIYLESKMAEAITLNENTILLRQKPSRSSVIEELIHADQFRKGQNDGSLISRLKNEIEAQKILLKNSKQYKLTPQEIKQTKSALDSYTKELRDLLGGNKDV